MLDNLPKEIKQASQVLKNTIVSLYDNSSQNFTREDEESFSKTKIEDEKVQNKSTSQKNQYSTESIFFFDYFSDTTFYDESLDIKINNLKMNSVSSRRKDELFKRYKKEQQEKINQRRKQLEMKYSFQQQFIKGKGQFFLEVQNKNEIFTVKNQDLEKLKPQTDLNDTILDNYLKLLRLKMLNPEAEQKTHIYSSFFMGKLCKDIIKDEPPAEKQLEGVLQKIGKRVEENYVEVKRWTKKIDIFQKQFLVIPINAYKHWNCVIVVSPNSLIHDSEMCRIIYLDSFFEKKSIFTQAIKEYLKMELWEKKKIETSPEKIQSYQLLVPRQTNTHDCGLYTLCFIEYFLTNYHFLQANMEMIENRQSLRIFPRSIVFTMRECLRRLFYGLLTLEDKEKVLKEYQQLRKQIFNSAIDVDYDQINERQFQKYYRINSQSVQEKSRSEAENEYLYKIKFYLDSEINHYEKDRL